MGIRQALGLSAAIAGLAGCSGTSGVNPTALGQFPGGAAQSSQRQAAGAGRLDNSLLPPTATRMFRQPIAGPSFMDVQAATHPLIFVSDTPDGVVDIYPQAGKSQKVAGQITGLNQPQGLAVDAQRNLYVANTNGSNVLVYAPPYSAAPILTLNDAGEFPADVAVSTTGVVAVTNICSAPRCRPNTASIAFYAKGGTTPCATVSDQAGGVFDLARVYFAGFDASGNLYVDGSDIYNEATFGFIQGGCQATTVSILGTSPAFSFYLPGSIAVTKSGELAIIDLEEHAIGTFVAPVTGGSLGNPLSVTPLTGSLETFTFALLASGNDVYTTDSGGTGTSGEFAYPTGGAAVNTIAVGGQPVGVAVSPSYQL